MEERPSSFRVADWRVDPDKNEVSKEDARRVLEPLAMDVFAYLLMHPTRVVTTDELLDAIWSDRNAEPGMVAKRISQVRQALGDSSKNPRYIATIQKRGYQMIADVSVLEDRASLPTVSEPAPTNTAKPASSKRPWWLATIAGGAVAGLILMVGVIAFQSRKAATVPAKPVIAVLPLANTSGDASRDFVADGLTEEIITQLGTSSDLHVISRTSSFAYKSSQLSVRKIASDLGADHLVVGAVAQENDNYRISIQIIDGKQDSQLWSGTFDRQGGSIFKLRADIAGEIVRVLDQPASVKANTQSAPKPIKRDAYEAYLKGIAYGGLFEDFASWAPPAIQNLETAVALDPGFAEAWARLAVVKALAGIGAPALIEPARSAALQAIDIDENSATGHAALGLVLFLHDWDLQGAQEPFVRALALNPNSGTILSTYSAYLSVTRQFDLAGEVLKRREIIFGGHPTLLAGLSADYYAIRQFENALIAGALRESIGHATRDSHEASALIKLGRFEDALSLLQVRFASCGTLCAGRLEALNSAADQGFETAIRSLLAYELSRDEKDHAFLAEYFGKLRETEETFYWLERMLDTRDPRLLGFLSSPTFDFLRSDQRADAFMARMNVSGLPLVPAIEAEVGRELILRGQTAQGLERLRLAISMAPDDDRTPRWKEALAMASFAQEDYDLAVSFAEEALDDSPPRDISVFSNLIIASSYGQLGLKSQASDALGRAQDNWPGDLDLQRDLAPLFVGGDANLRDRYFEGLAKAGL